MKPKKTIVDEFVASGEFIKFNKEISATYLLISLAMQHVGMAEEIAKKKGLYVGEFKFLCNNTEKAFDRFCVLYQDLVRASGVMQDFIDDYTLIGAKIDELLDL